MAKVTKTFQYGQHQVTLETGEIARQASSVIVRMGDTVVLVTAVGNKNAKEGQDFFPLTVDYIEKFYAGGRIPGGFFKREGRVDGGIRSRVAVRGRDARRRDVWPPRAAGRDQLH